MKYKPGDIVACLEANYTFYICTAADKIYQYDIFENGKCVCAASSCPQDVFESEVRPLTKLEKALK